MPKMHVIATLYLFPALQNCESLSIKRHIDLVSTDYFRFQNSTWLGVYVQGDDAFIS